MVDDSLVAGGGGTPEGLIELTGIAPLILEQEQADGKIRIPRTAKGGFLNCMKHGKWFPSP